MADKKSKSKKKSVTGATSPASSGTRAGTVEVERPPIFEPPGGIPGKPVDKYPLVRTPAWKPTLLIQVVHFLPDDRPHAAELGEALYSALCRPWKQPLSFGAGVPVMIGADPDCVDTAAAKHVIVVCALGKQSVKKPAVRNKALKCMHQWQQALGDGHVIAVPFVQEWRVYDSQLPGVSALTRLYQKRNKLPATVDMIVREVAAKLNGKGNYPTLFISHAKADLDATGRAAETIEEYARNNRNKVFFDFKTLTPGKRLSEQIAEHMQDDCVFLAIRSDSYSSRNWCLDEVLAAKRQFLPTLSVTVFRKGESRSLSFGGNNPSMVWNQKDKKCAQKVVSRALVEWVKRRLFQEEAKRVQMMAALPEVIIRNRAPELLDVVDSEKQTRLLLYPDPQLPPTERQVIAAANRRLGMTTPTNAYRYLSSQSAPDNSVGTPLDGLQVALSVSDSKDIQGPEGYTTQHIQDAVVYVTRCLVAAGAQIGYGGDFRRFGFTEILAQLVRDYNEQVSTNPKLMHSYLGAPIEPGGTDAVGATNEYSLRDAEPADKRMKPMIPWTPKTKVQPGLYFSDMRRVLAKCVSAAVIIAGASKPKTSKDSEGYGGLYPGVVEEAWRMLKVRRPLYVIGGFGGAGKIVADLLEGKATPKDLREKTHARHDFFRKTSRKIKNSDWRKRLGLPQNMDEMGVQIRRMGAAMRKSDATSLEWNGLTYSENLALHRTRDPAEIAGLVLKGILIKVSAEVADDEQLEVELVHGDVLAARGIDALSVPTYEGVPLGGVAGGVDDALGGGLTNAVADGQSLVAVKNADYSFDWVHLAGLTPQAKRGALPFNVAAAANDAVARTLRFGFRRLGVVLFGGSVIPNEEKKAVDAMIGPLLKLAGRSKVVWYEADDARFELIKKQLQSRKWKSRLRLTSRQGEPLQKLAVATKSQRTVLTVHLSDDMTGLTTLFMPVSGTGIARTRTTRVASDQINELGVGIGPRKRSVPQIDDLRNRAGKLARLLFGRDPAEYLKKIRASGLQITHNLAASKIPFELLGADEQCAVAAEASINRRLIIDDAQSRKVFAQPPVAGAPAALLIINPTEDVKLEGAEKEGKIVKAILRGFARVKTLPGKRATKSRVLSEFAKADIIHFCGHAFYDGPGPDDSGICLADGNLTVRDIQRLDSRPRLAFFNACEAARLRNLATAKPNDQAVTDQSVTDSAAFAEVFLRGGVQAYVGTYWYVHDVAAQRFAVEMYKQLESGATVAAAVLEARKALFEDEHRDWANYILFGEGDFRI